LPAIDRSHSRIARVAHLVLAPRHRRLIASLLCAASLGCPSAAISADAGPSASTAHTSRWWKITCDGKPARCVLTVHLRGVINESRLQLFNEALRRRDTTQKRLGRPVAVRADLDSQGGQVFAALEIGRLLRREAATVRVGPGASCISACVFVLMGAPQREVAGSARIGLHSPSLGDARRDALVPDMAEHLAHYAEEMGVSPQIVDAMLAIPASRVRFATTEELARYGLALTVVR
jgi:ATP-dependent protease ClpP protease subunit